MHKLVAFTFTSELQADADGVHEFNVPVGITILGVSLCSAAFGDSASAFTIDIQDDGTDVITGVAANTAGTPGTWYTPPLGGTEDPVHIAADSDVEIDFNLSGGTGSETADATIVIYATIDEV